MNAVANAIDHLNRAVGSVTRWFILAMVVIQFGIVIFRYSFGISSVAAQESVLYLHSATFMLAAAYTLLCNKHVRVDIFYTNLSSRAQRRIDKMGHLFFLIPSMTVLLYWSWPSIRNAWKVKEGAISVGGLPYVYLLKTLILMFCTLLILQSISLLIRLFSASGKAK